MNQNELNKILADHKLWLETKGKEGKRANLRRADLRDANLRNANLSRADLEGADLRYANLQGTDLEGVDLAGADLTGTNLKGTWLDSDWKSVPVVLGNVLVTECESHSKRKYWNKIKTWSVIKEDNQELYEVLYL